MTCISFWNLQRFGGTTEQQRKTAIRLTIDPFKPDLELYAELTPKATDLEPQNITHKRKNTSQLCYAAQDNAHKRVKLDKAEPQSTPEYRKLAIKGGNNFMRMRGVNRGLASAGSWNGVDVYTFHAPASKRATAAMLFVAFHLASKPGTKWLVVGDFNVTPDVLQPLCAGKGINVVTPERGRFTHFTRRSKTSSTLDYVLTNLPNVKVTAFLLKEWLGISDHSPIIVKY